MGQIVILQGDNFGGLNTDKAPWDLPLGSISNGYNFRNVNNKLVSFGGYTEIAALLADYALGQIDFVGTTYDIVYLLCGTTAVVSYDGNEGVVILDLSTTPVSSAQDWTITKLGGTPICNHPELGAFYWYPVSSTNQLQPLPFDTLVDPDTLWETATLEKSGKIIRSHKNFLFMLNLTEVIGGISTPIPDGYRWSHPADANASYPVTWDETNQFYLAGFAQLGAHSGHIIDALELRDSFVIYSERAINVLDLSGDTFVWSRRELTTSLGLLAKNCVVEVNGKHYLLGATDAAINDGFTITPIMYGQIKKHYVANLHTDFAGYSFVVHNKNYNEIWFCVPTGSSERPNLAYIYNYLDNTCAIKDLPANVQGGQYGPISTAVVTWDSLSTSPSPPSWQTYYGPWGIYGGELRNSVLTVHDNGTINNVDPFSIFGGTAPTLIGGKLNTILERTNLVLVDQSTATSIVCAYPHIEGTSKVKITLGSQSYAGAPIRWKPSVVFTPGVNRKVDVITTGILHAWKIESIDDNRFTFSGMDLEYVVAGKR